MAEKISLVVNGKRRTVEVEGWEKLLDVLRDRLGLLGTKRGCDDASCGACTVLVNDRAVRSCIYPISKFKDAEILTIEAMAEGGQLHPIQQALIDAGAVQCGFCMPGIVMRLHALFQGGGEVDDAALLDALSSHLCRCTGYEAILEGARRARDIVLRGRT